MFIVHHGNEGQFTMLSLYRMLCICATYVQVVSALPQGAVATDSNAPTASLRGGLALIPSAPSRQTQRNTSFERPGADFGVTPSLGLTALIPSAPTRAQAPPPELVPSAHPSSTPAPSQPPSSQIPSAPPPGLIPSAPPAPIASTPPGLIPSVPPPPSLNPSAPDQSNPGIISSAPMPSVAPGTSNVDVTRTPVMASTDEPLRPIPPETTAPGNPDGHHEIPEPNFTATAPCRGCSPVVEISVTGWLDTPVPAAEHAETTVNSPPKATITAGPSNVVVSQAPSGGGFVIGDTTVRPGQTVVIDNTPVAVQTSAGRTEVVVGTATVPFQPAPQAANNPNHITNAPIPPILTIGNEIVTADSASHYVIAGKTLVPGGPAITIDGKIISLLPSATAIVINGVTSTLAQAYGAIYTTTDYPLLTLNNHVYTANRAGYYSIAPGITLVPGGAAITVSGTVISLEPHGTAAVIQGSTSAMLPVTTIVTVTKAGGGGGFGEGAGYSSDPPGNLAYPTGKHNSAGVGLRVTATVTDGWLEGLFMLGCIGLGWLAVWL